MIVRKNEEIALIKIKCPKCESENTSYWKFNKNTIITSKSKIRCNDCSTVHRLDKCILETVEVK